jgi:hypothetical protein
MNLNFFLNHSTTVDKKNIKTLYSREILTKYKIGFNENNTQDQDIARLSDTDFVFFYLGVHDEASYRSRFGADKLIIRVNKFTLEQNDVYMTLDDYGAADEHELILIRVNLTTEESRLIMEVGGSKKLAEIKKYRNDDSHDIMYKQITKGLHSAIHLLVLIF